MAPKAFAPLALLHAFPYDGLMWSAQRAALETHTTVHVMNAPGFGGTRPFAGSEPTLDAYASLLLEHLPERFVVAGNSLGGYLALAMLRIAPARIAGLALVNSRAIADDDDRRAARLKLIAEVRGEGVERFRSDCISSEARRNNGTPAPESLFASMTAQGVIDGARVLATRPDQRAALGDITVPAVYVYGVADPIIALDEAQSIVEHIPEATFVPVLGAGHICGLDSPAEVSEALLSLLRRCA